MPQGDPTFPWRVGFGIKERADVDFLRGKADIAVIGTETIRLVDEHGVGRWRGLSAGCNPDGSAKRPISALRCISKSLRHAISTPHAAEICAP